MVMGIGDWSDRIRREMEGGRSTCSASAASSTRMHAPALMHRLRSVTSPAICGMETARMRPAWRSHTTNCQKGASSRKRSIRNERRTCGEMGVRI